MFLKTMIVNPQERKVICLNRKLLKSSWSTPKT